MKIVNIQPAQDARDVILQAAIVLVFDREINTETLSEQTFLLSGPGENGVQTPQGLIDNNPAVEGREYVQGVFSFALNGDGHTVATFRPARPLRPNVQYSILVSGVLAVDNEPLDGDYAWKFRTGVLNLKEPPRQNPLPSQVGRIREEELVVTPSSTLNGDLHTIEIEFPEDIDPAFDVNKVQVNLEAFLQDPDVPVPTIKTKQVRIEGKKLIVELTFEPEQA